MHLYDEEQHVLIEAAGTLLFVVGVLRLAGVDLPLVGDAASPALAVVVIAVGLTLMGYQKLARRLVGLLDRDGDAP